MYYKEIFDLKQLISLFKKKGVKRILAKVLSANDNSKNQIYFGGSFESLRFFPRLDIKAEATGKKGPIFKSPLEMYWVRTDGMDTVAPGVQLIYYPQYPEVRLSGFLQRAEWAPKELLNVRQKDRVLFLGVCPDGRVYGHIVSPENPITGFINSKEYLWQDWDEGKGPSVFKFLELEANISPIASIPEIIKVFEKIHRKGWVPAQRIKPDGSLMIPYRGQNAAGYTLEALLGVFPSGNSEPDYRGWEVKCTRTNVVTLMTPEPDQGLYISDFDAFMQCYAHDVDQGRYFTGKHTVGKRNRSTGLLMNLFGFNFDSFQIIDSKGSVRLEGDQNDSEYPAEWKFENFLNHWSRKHSKAVFMGADRRESGGMEEFNFKGCIECCKGAEPRALLRALAAATVFYDPAVRMMNNGTVKKRNQFRVNLSQAYTLYEDVQEIIF